MDARINGLTIESLVQDGTGVAVEGGAPDLSDLAYVSDGFFVLIGGGGAGGTLRDSTSTADITFFDGASTLATGVRHSPRPGRSAPITWIDGRGTTVRFVGNELSTVAIEGGSPTFEDIDFSGIDAAGDSGVAAWAGADTTATIRNNLFHDWSGAGVDVGGLFVIEGNTFRANRSGVVVGPGAAATITGNTIEGSSAAAIYSQAGSRVNIVGNVLHGNAIGIETTTDGGDELVPAGSAVLGIVEDNALSNNTTAMVLAGSSQIISGNTITGGSQGIVIRGGSSPTIEGNTVNDTAGDGILIQTGSSPRVSDNSLGGNARNMTVEEGAEAAVLDNELCASP